MFGLLHYWSYALQSYIYRVSQEEKTIFWEVIVSVSLSKKLYMNMCPIPNGGGRERRSGGGGIGRGRGRGKDLSNTGIVQAFLNGMIFMSVS
jgi:hypothetical protein